MKPEPRIIVSACLCGVSCRYDGRANTVDTLASLYECGLALPVCPEVDGGLTVPRPPCELVGGRAVSADGLDLTGAFESGAQHALEMALKHGIRIAVLKEKSPSCGNTLVYDGTFSGVLIEGQGVASRLLASSGIQVCNEHNFHKFI